MPREAVPPWFGPLVAAPFAGSVAGVLVCRLPRGEPVAVSRSRCDACGHRLGPAELIPVLSFAWQQGRCRHCQARIPRSVLAIELAAFAVAASAALCVEAGPWLWADCVFGWWLLALGWIDWTHLRLPDSLTLPLLLTGLAQTAWLDPAALLDHAIAAALGYALLQALAVLYRRWRQRDGLGGGDPKLMAAIGAWVGLAGVGPVLLIAALCGLAAATIRGGALRADTVVPLGTCLAGGAWVVRLVG